MARLSTVAHPDDVFLLLFVARFFLHEDPATGKRVGLGVVHQRGVG